MKAIRLIYFHIYNSYYKDGDYDNDIPHLTAFGIVGCSLSIILLAIMFSVYLLLLSERPTFGIVVVPFVILLVYFYFTLMHDSKYQAIYSEFKNSKWDTTILKVLSWATMPVAFVLAGLFAYIFNHPH
jgi:hypothetical protein